MKVHPLIAGAIVAAIIGLQSWTLHKVVDLHADVAVLTERVNNISKSGPRASATSNVAGYPKHSVNQNSN